MPVYRKNGGKACLVVNQIRIKDNKLSTGKCHESVMLKKWHFLQLFVVFYKQLTINTIHSKFYVYKEQDEFVLTKKQNL